MFEKEALIYATVSLPDGYTKIDYQKKTDWQKGAEFGYNKCKEELNQKGLALQSDMDKTIEQNIALKNELEKANEWHNPKEKLPTKDCEVLIEYDEHKIHRVVDWNNKSQHFGGFSIDEVTRWKKIE